MPGDDRFIEIQERPSWKWDFRQWRWWQIVLVGLMACTIVGATAVAGVIWYFSQDVPSLEQLHPDAALRNS
jgi:penicillin-binding protein 1A